MTVHEALKSIHKPRCSGGSCAQCEYLASECDDPEVMDIVKTLHIMPLTFKKENGVWVGHAADRSGSVIYPKGEKPFRPTVNLVDIGLWDED